MPFEGSHILEHQFSTTHVDVLAVGRRFKPDVIEKYATKYAGERIRDVICMQLPKGVVFVFDYGVLVTWGLNSATKQQLKSDMLGFVDAPRTELQWEQFKFSIVAEATTNMQNDHIVLPNSEVNNLLAASHAFAQSAKLINFERHAESLIADNSKLVNKLAENGKIPLNRKQIAKLRGSLFQAKNDIVLNFNLFDIPEYFWDHPEFEGYHKSIAGYLEINPRVELLTIKLATISELLDMLADEQNHKYAANLEWIVILLIALYIVLFFFH